MERNPLPIDEVLPGLQDALLTSQAVVLTAPPGSGKSTRVPPAILGTGLAGGGRVVVLQPRRMAARAVAARMAQERGERLGETAGYRVRFDERVSAKTRILVVTEGILTRRFLQDPFLEGIACVILDEFHERSVHGDLALAFCRELMQVRDDLKVVVMSATLQTGPVARFLGGCPVLGGGARPFEVRIEHLGEVDARPLEERTAEAVRRVLGRDEDDGGDVLVFLPGAPEIRRVGELLDVEAEVLPLYGALPAREQDRALKAGVRRRVVLATNIAETSLTVPGVTTVVDTGRCKQMRYDPASGLDRLETMAISRQSADQRAGRAGRTAPGRVVRLWTRHEHRGLPEVDEPEIRRVDLAPHMLSVLAFHPGDPTGFPFFEAPRPATLEASLALLRRLGAVSPQGFELTDKGHRLGRLPIHPRIGCVLEGASRKGVLLAALLSERELLADPAPGPTDSDLLERLERFEELERAGITEGNARRLGIRFGAALAVREGREQLLRLTARKRKSGRGREQRRDLLALPLKGFPDRVCRRREAGGREGVMVGGRGVRLADSSGVREPELFVALAADAGRRGERSTALVRMASAVDEALLEAELPHLIAVKEEAWFDPVARAAVGVRRRYFDDLLLGEQRGVPVGAEDLSAVLADEAGKRFTEVFKPDKKARQLRARLALAADVLREDSWPDVSDAGLKAWLPDLCGGRSRLEEIERIDWSREMLARLDHRLRPLLDQELPERVRVPSGSRVQVDYEKALAEEGSPVLSVRLQELFGLADTPRVARGRVPVLLHLLAPNGRAVQVTRDLRSFWNDTYPQIRKELRARYPRHSWPDDPWSARPTRRARRRDQ